MNTSDWINVILCILSFLLAAISVGTVIITIRQNHKMIQNSTRPYIVVFPETTNYQTQQMYLILKNYGNSGAKITKFYASIDLSNYSLISEHPPFSKIENTFLAPGQKIITPIDAKKLSEDKCEVFTIVVGYSDGVKSYYEEYPINYVNLQNNVQLRASTKDKELKIISYTLQDFAEKQL